MKHALVITEPQGGEFFSFAVWFRLIHVPEVWILGTPDSEDCKSFPVNTVFRYIQVPFKAGLTVTWQILIWLFLHKWFKGLNRILVSAVEVLATITYNFYCCVCDRLCGLVVRVSGYRYRGLGLDSRRYQIFWVVVGRERGPLSLVRSIEELLE